MTGIRPLVRLAWRDAARNRWRTVLVISMIAIPVAVQVTHSTLVRTVVPTMEETLDNRMGEADISLSAGSSLQPADVAAALAPGGGRGVAIRTTEARTAELGELLTVSELALDDPLVRGMLRLTSGRAPATAAEVAVDPGLLRRYRLRLGGTLSLRRPDLSATVVGTVINPERLADPVVVAGPGALPADAPTRYLIALGGTSLASLRQALPAPAPEPGAMVSRQGTAAGSASARPLMILVSFALALVIMSETGLVAAAAFAVGARRQQRELGLLAINGGTPAHVRAAVLLNAVVLGTAGALSGIAFGLGAALAFRPYLDGLTNRIVGHLDVSPPMLAAVALLGVGAASVAAWQPARTAARVSVLASLAARRPASRPAGPLAGIGLGAAVAGGAVLAAGGRNGNAWAAAGLIGVMGGVVATSPALVAALGRVAGRLPTTLRLAGRDIARHQTRSAAAVAAALLALAAPVGFSTLTLSAEVQVKRSGVAAMGEDQLLVQSETGLEPADTGRLDRVATAIASSLAGSVAAPLSRATAGAGADGTRQVGLVSTGIGDELGQSGGGVGVLEVSSPALLRALGIDTPEVAVALAEGKVVGLGSGSVEGATVRVRRSEDPGAAVTIPAITAGVARSALPRYLVSADVAARLGFGVSTSAWLVRASRALAEAQVTGARRLAAANGLLVVVHGGSFDASTARTVVLAGTAVAGLAIVGTAVALVAAESRQDARVLAAVGAGPGIRRRLAAADTALLAGMAGLLAVPAGFVPATAFLSAQPGGFPVVVPWPAVAGVALAVPIVGGLAAAAFTRAAPRSILAISS